MKKIDIYAIENKGKFNFNVGDFVNTFEFREMNFDEAIDHFLKSYNIDDDFDLFCNVLNIGLRKSEYTLPSGAKVRFTPSQVRGMITCLEYGVDFRTFITPYLTDNEVSNIESGVIAHSNLLIPYNVSKLNTIVLNAVKYALTNEYNITPYYTMSLTKAHFLLMLEEAGCEVRSGKSTVYTVCYNDDILFYFNPRKFSSDMIETLKNYIKDGVSLDLIANYITLRYDNYRVILHQKLATQGFDIDIKLLPKLDIDLCSKIDNALNEGTYSNYMTELLGKELYNDVSRYLELGWSDTKALLHQSLIKQGYKSDILALDDLDDDLCKVLSEALKSGVYEQSFKEQLNKLKSNLDAMSQLNSEDIIEQRRLEQDRIKKEKYRSNLIDKYGK